ncbi:MAG: 3',5'-cyclic-nucleotide phosphodiesterase [Thiotrichales bacterium]|nr:MAG: 3',5'-cyclic-nucleotide phosphodiesterase [Thiotrichales bacterium]
MRIRVLGCSGGIYQGAATTSFLIDDDILIDAGSGAAELTLEQMRAVRHIFLTHAHLDHIVSIPLLADSVFGHLVGNPIIVHAQQETLDVLQAHIFNSQIWPDFTALPDRSRAVLRLEAMPPGSRTEIHGRSIEMIAVNHVVPGVGYRVESTGRSFAFSGDTTSSENLWAALNSHDDLDLLFIESAYANRDIGLARSACHYCPQLLSEDLARLKHRPQVGITHLHPGEEAAIMNECREALPGWDLRQLKSGDVFVLERKDNNE